MKNETFMIYYALLIIMVIDCHCNSRMAFLTSIFPYDSFFMPAFVFISGYFYKSKGFLPNIKHKFLKLWIPYMVWNFVFILITIAIDALFHTEWGDEITLRGVIVSSFLHPCTNLNGASWFVVMLFEVCVAYEVVCLVTKNDALKTSLIIAISIIGLYLSIYHYPEGKGWEIIVTCYRTMFYLFFYNAGYLFKLYFERLFHKISKEIVMLNCICVGAVLNCLFGEKIRFIQTSHMHKFNYILLPFISACIGIIFYYELCRCAKDVLTYNEHAFSFIKIISRNTFCIMEVHLLFINVPIIFIKRMNIVQWYEKFSLEANNTNPWVVGDRDLSYIQFWISLLLSIT